MVSLLKRGVPFGLSLGILPAAPAAAASAAAVQRVTVTVMPAARLSLGSTSVDFERTTQAQAAPLSAESGGVAVTARARTGGRDAVLLTVQADGDLSSGADTMDIGNLTWKGSGAGFQDGRMSKTTAQSVASWTGSGVRSGMLDYTLDAGFDAAPGTYTATLVYTLTTP